MSINIYPEEIGFIATNRELAKQVFEKGIGLDLIHKGKNSNVYRLNKHTELNVWTDGKKHPLSQAYVSFAVDKDTILKTAKVVENWNEGVLLRRLEDDEGNSFLFLTINFPDGSDLGLSDQFWHKPKLKN